MHFHYGLGVGRTYSHRPEILEGLGSALYPAAQTEDVEYIGTEQSLMETTHWQHAANDENEEGEDHLGIEESILFEQQRNGSTKTLIEALEEMYTNHVLDYEN
ncbi:hypothetical protein DFJ58DRAFT_734533 [Suillus subalutaceus]|uniref:uncharacterized protein n=1 Tax=Suillus subalutaceus TaxID=48586 RepID=UPI001B85D96B|nr:uncharacterized protein DFJ58DRAFT_734533 [Suillus subalutaceus]KAG1837179.1 hypothetical protein DFJ58DRAFT_734533 [Suillus subalutaceus]